MCFVNFIGTTKSIQTKNEDKPPRTKRWDRERNREREIRKER
jgi:hypothetical protein